MSHAYFVSGGSEAMEAALKMARQYFVEIGQPQRRHFIARQQSYHGNTLGALAVGGNAWRRRQFAPLLIPVTHVSACYEYRDRRAGETRRSLRRSAWCRNWPAPIDRLGGDTVIAFVAETVGGATSGALTPVPGYLQGVRELCDRHGILLHPGRGDVRHGPHRHPARLRAGRRGARPAGHRQGPGRRLPADRRGAGAPAHRRGLCHGQRAVPARPHLPRPPDGLRRGAGGAAGDPAATTCSPPCSARARPARAPAGRLRRAPARRRHPRPRPVPGHRTGGRPRQQGALRPGAAGCTRASRPPPWPRA